MTDVMTHRPALESDWRHRRAWRIAVDLDGAATAEVALVGVRHRLGPAGAEATFEWAGGSADFGIARRLARRGARCRARIVRSRFPGQLDDWPMFDGYLVAARVEFDGGGRRLLLDAIDGVTRRHGEKLLIGRRGFDAAGQMADADEMLLVFNEGGRPNRSQNTATVNGRETWLFEYRAEEAAYWSAADAINYLLALHLAGDASLALPSRSRIESLCGEAIPRGMNLTGRSLLSALEQLGELAGAGFAIEPRQSLRGGSGWRLRWFGPGGDRAVALRHQRAGSSLHPAGTNVAAGRLDFDHDDARHVWVAVGGPDEVESTFDLVGGWDPNLESGDHRTFTRANDDFHAVRDVYRRWVLNEAGDWTASPYSRGAPPDLGDLFGAEQVLLRRRRFGPCLSRDPAGESFGVFVEVSHDSGTTWRRYPGRIEVLSEEAGVRIADDQLPPDYWQSARAGTLAVRATATLQGDRRLSVELEDPVRPDGSRTVRHLRWLSDRYRRSRVDASSRFADDESAASADIADDRDALASALRQEIARSKQSATAGRLALPWLNVVYRPGDRVRGLSGQGLSFAAGDSLEAREPLIRAVEHRLGDEWQTFLELE